MITRLVLLAGLGLIPPVQGYERHCLKALAGLGQGAVPTSEVFTEVGCPSPPPRPAFRYDQAQSATRVSRQIAKDEIVPMFPGYGVGLVVPGQRLVLVVMAGTNRIERKVEALQAARSGQRLFVRSDDGQVFAARYEAAAP